jgi:hypothetical protein
MNLHNSSLKKEAEFTSERSVSAHKTTWHSHEPTQFIPEEGGRIYL